MGTQYHSSTSACLVLSIDQDLKPPRKLPAIVGDPIEGFVNLSEFVASQIANVLFADRTTASLRERRLCDA
jgi:hypothetical protein